MKSDDKIAKEAAMMTVTEARAHRERAEKEIGAILMKLEEQTGVRVVQAEVSRMQWVSASGQPCVEYSVDLEAVI